jgi:hypothetical protein
VDYIEMSLDLKVYDDGTLKNKQGGVLDKDKKMDNVQNIIFVQMSLLTTCSQKCMLPLGKKMNTSLWKICSIEVIPLCEQHCTTCSPLSVKDIYKSFEFMFNMI